MSRTEKERKPPSGAVFPSPRAFARETEKYFSEHLPDTGEIPDLKGLCCFLDISREAFFELASDERYRGKAESALCRIAAYKKQLAMKGDIPPTVFCFDFKNNHGYSDKPESNARSGCTIVLDGKAGDWSV